MFLAIEGGDGVGKSTAIAALAAHLREAGRTVLTTREPGGTPEGIALRALLLPKDAAWEPWSELLLMTAARVQHVQRIIRPALAAGTIVISDRFIGSTLAYQGAGRGISTEAILLLHREATGDFRPDLTIVLDLDPSVGIARSTARLARTASNEGRFEALDLSFHNRVRASFLTQAAADPRAHVVVDAAWPVDDVAQAVIRASGPLQKLLF